MNQEKIRQYFTEHRQAMLDDISKLVAINSERSEACEGQPYGEGAARALACAMDIAKEMGFNVKNYDNHVCTVDMNEHETQLDILAHLDIVPVGDGWTMTEPLVTRELDGRLYGRGTADDKGPAIAALYAMRAVRDLGIPLSKNVRLILGTDEETGSADLKHYYRYEKEAPVSFSPDGDFPVINIEKGSLATEFTASFAESTATPRVLSVDGGTRPNVVPSYAKAVVVGFSVDEVRALCARHGKELGAAFTVSSNDDTVAIECKGTGAHASTPYVGINAVTALLTVLSRMAFAPCDGFDRLCSAVQIFPHGDWEGKAAGIAMEDELSGKLTIAFDIFHYTPTILSGTFDSRTPLCATDANMRDVIRAALASGGLTLAKTPMRQPHHVPADSAFIRTLLSCYEQYTGQTGECLAIGGATYVHNLKNGVAFGCAMPGVNNNMHGPDEFAVIDDLLLSGMIFTQAIAELCR